MFSSNPPLDSALGPRLAALLAILCFCAGWARLGAADIPARPVAAVTGGSISGQLLPHGGAVFRGIPFAQPPVGALRWREPLPVVPWDGVRDAVASGPPAAQASFGWNERAAAESREDCLYLDVWTPTALAPASNPVMVWIHGGGNVAGAGGFDPVYDGASLLAHGVVLVVVEYRLGIFGFLAHPELTRESPRHASGNYALLDQLAALRWVQGNIARFGGDPGRVTIFGQSAGGTDVIALMASPLSRGLFQRAIAESGPLGGESSQSLADAELAGAKAAAKLNAPAEGGLPFLRSLPVADLLKATIGFHPFTVDGWVFPVSPLVAWSTGKEQPVPLIVGSNAIEFASGGSLDDMRKAISTIFKADAPKALALYGLDGPPAAADPLYGNAQDQWGSDLFRCPGIVQGEWHGASGHPVWEYQFDRAIPPHPHVAHSGEIPYVFGNFHLTTGNLAGDYQEADRKLSGAVQAYWTNFARTGNPNAAGLPDWPEYDGRVRNYLEFTAAGTVALAQNQRGPFADLFRDLLRREAAAP